MAVSKTPGTCDQCKSTGLPLLPVRYAVVPKDVKPGLPAWASGERVKDVALGEDFAYALRTVREGYLYLYYSKNARGSNQWECYTVWADGCLHKQADTELTVPSFAPTFQCSREGHNPLSVHYLVIEKPEKCGTTWIAFSDHKWSKETVTEYQQNAKLRDARMQQIEPAAMAKGTKQAHGAIVEAAALNGVLEYAPDFDASKLPHEAVANPFSEENGSYKAERLNKLSTRYPLNLRKGEAESTVKHMKQRGKEATPHVLALWDAIGIVHELNGFRNDAAGWLNKYGEERELQITAVNAIEGTQKALEKKQQESMSQHQKRVMGRGAFQDTMRVKPNPRGWPETARWEPFTAREDILKHGLGMGYVVLPQAHIDQSIAQTWGKYEAKLDKTALATFKKHWSGLLEKADTIIDRRTVALVNWLEAPLLIDSLEDCNPKNIEDGLIFEQAVGDAIFGMGSSKTGQKKIDAWIAQAKASIKSNLLWRAIALNQEIGIKDVDAALVLAEQHKDQRTIASALNTEGIVAKTLKAFADTHKKASSVLTGNTSAKGEAGNVAFGARIKPIKTRDLDKLATTVGDRVLAHFKVDGLADHISEKIMQHMFSIRAMVDPKDSLALVVAQAAAEPASRGHLLQRMSVTETFLGASTAEIKTAQADNLRSAWQNFKGTAKGADAIRDARLAVLVMLIEGLNFQKLLAECKTKGDGKTYWSLAASSMTISSGLFDIASVPAKNVFGAESWSYQKIKLYGGVLSVAATGVGVGLDVYDASKSVSSGKVGIAFLYGVKAGLGGANLALTAATTFTYAAPLIGRLTGNPVYAGAARSVSVRAAAIIGRRILFMSAGAWLTVGIFGIQVFIWIFTDDDLQSWCERSAFGLKRDSGWTPKRQMEEYTEALKSVGVGS
ncbi:T6SS effector BTH_I2691 family protein [Quatrionicoccus australiensis]|uniref:T6SS effector BTH_I2691 family protein n=1 Tax=Quatrionicoccus australiensis TaxID=138118 RepID=UPI001CF9EA4F|nr:T6SS effector BTH_I2691 family protein [Quatrionicoccus australiensis]MCB4359496.1 hypothetical protein [Quatrionicoccus australiensis]